jgi:hypothetical protein
MRLELTVGIAESYSRSHTNLGGHASRNMVWFLLGRRIDFTSVSTSLSFHVSP